MESSLNPDALDFFPSTYTNFLTSTSSSSYYPTPPPPLQHPQLLPYFPTYQTEILPENLFTNTYNNPHFNNIPPPPPPPPFLHPHETEYNSHSHPTPHFSVTIADTATLHHHHQTHQIEAAAKETAVDSSGSSRRRGRRNWREREYYNRVVKYGGGRRYHQHKVVPLQPQGHATTVMIRNIPSKYTRKMLLQFLDEHCMNENAKEQFKINSGEQSKDECVWSAIDFLYMPMDFKTGWNKSYAFVNFTETRAVWKFYKACHNQKWEFCQSNKIRAIVSAKIQGKEALVEHLGHTAFACDSDEYLPVCFNPPRDGSDFSSSVIITVGKRITPTLPQSQSPLLFTTTSYVTPIPI